MKTDAHGNYEAVQYRHDRIIDGKIQGIVLQDIIHILRAQVSGGALVRVFDPPGFRPVERCWVEGRRIWNVPLGSSFSSYLR